MRNQNTTRIRPQTNPVSDNPYCIGCKHFMIKAGAYKGIVRWRCRPCDYSVAARVLRNAPEQPFSENPCCLKCRRTMRKGTTKRPAGARARIWRCSPCGLTLNSDRPTRQRDPQGHDLQVLIEARIKDYSIEMREELRGEIAIMILSHRKLNGERVTAQNLTPSIVREIARKFVRPLFMDRFRHVSLEHRYGEDGQRLEERLVG